MEIVGLFDFSPFNFQFQNNREEYTVFYIKTQTKHNQTGIVIFYSFC